MSRRSKEAWARSQENKFNGLIVKRVINFAELLVTRESVKGYAGRSFYDLASGIQQGVEAGVLTRASALGMLATFATVGSSVAKAFGEQDIETRFANQAQGYQAGLDEERASQASPVIETATS